MINQAMTSRCAEFFAPDGRFGDVYVQIDGATHKWPHWPVSVCDALSKEIEASPKIRQGLRAMEVPVGLFELQVVAACRHGLYNVAADFDQNGKCTDLEVRTDCPHRHHCPGAGLVCLQKATTPTGDTITRAEMETAVLVGQGLTNKEIADRQGLKLISVVTRVANIFSKLNIQSRSQLTNWIARMGLL